MQTLCIEAAFEGEIKLNDECVNYFADKKTIALFASVQFMALDDVKAQLRDKEILLTKAKRTNALGQILGCDSYHDSFEEDIISKSDAVLYVGDGYFHPKALLLSQIYNEKIVPIVIWDPVNQKMEIIDIEHIKKQIGKMRANLVKYLTADTVGILVTVKPGQQYLNRALALKKSLEEKGKKAYIFLDDDIQLNLLDNYPFCQVWVNTACPRIGQDDHVTIEKSLINIREAFFPEKALEKLHNV